MHLIYITSYYKFKYVFYIIKFIILTNNIK